MKNFNYTYSYNEILEAIKDLRENGLSKGYSLGIQEMDEAMKLDKGKLCTVYGIPNQGKSTFVDFMCVQLNKLHGFRTLFFSAEDTLAMHLYKLMAKYKFEKDTTDEQKARIVADNFGFLDYEKVYTVEKLIDVAEEEIRTKHFDVFVIDPFNKLEAAKEYNVLMTDYISKFLDKLLRLTKKYNIITLLVVHPRKLGTYYTNTTLNPYDIADSAHFFNKSDYCLSVGGEKDQFTATIKVDKVKYNHLGIGGTVKLKYDDKSGNFYHYDDELDKILGEPQQSKQNDIDLLDITVDSFYSLSMTDPKPCNLKDLLMGNENDSYNKLVDAIRATEDEKDRREKKKKLLNFCINARFNGKRCKENVSELTHLLYIDIDYKDNMEIINEVPNILKSIEHVVFFQKSSGGKGYMAIIPYQQGLNFGDVWNAVEADFRDLGITIDSCTKNIDRVTLYSYDLNHYYNPNAEVYSKTLHDKEAKSTKKQLHKKSTDIMGMKGRNAYLKQLVSFLDEKKVSLDNGSYKAWEAICMALISEFGDSNEGLNYFKQLSHNYKGYDEFEATAFYNNHIRYEDQNQYHFGTIKHYAKELGFES